MATVTAIHQPFLVAVRNTAIGTHWGGGGGGGAVIQMFDKTPATEKFPNLHPHGALYRANMVLGKGLKNYTWIIRTCEGLL